MTKEQPTFVFVPGSWHTPAHFAPLISALAKHQLPSNCVSLPSNSTTSSKDVELKHDVAAVREAVEKLVVKEEKEVLVVMHSSGGMVGSDALLGLSLKERSQLGRRGGVVRLVYIAALIFPEGTQVAPRDDLSKVPSWAQIDENTRSLIVAPSEAANIFYNDLSESEASKWTKELVPQSYKVWWTATSYAAWRHIPSTSILATNDLAAPFAGHMLKAAMESDPTMFDSSETIEGGHSPFLSQIDSLVGILKRAAKDE